MYQNELGFAPNFPTSVFIVPDSSPTNPNDQPEQNPCEQWKKYLLDPMHLPGSYQKQMAEKSRNKVPSSAGKQQLRRKIKFAGSSRKTSSRKTETRQKFECQHQARPRKSNKDIIWRTITSSSCITSIADRWSGSFESFVNLVEPGLKHLEENFERLDHEKNA